MRLSTKLGASMSAAALGSAVVLGGAGIAQAQSLDAASAALGSADAPEFVLTVEGDEDAVGGEIANNTDAPVTCDITATSADAAGAIEEAFADGSNLGDAIGAAEEYLAAGVAGQNAFAGDVVVDALGTETWVGADFEDTVYGPDEDYLAGAVAQCDDEVVFAYESDALFGSLDMGSLQS